MSSTRLKHIVIDEDNYRALKELGRTGDSFNDVLKKVLKKINVQQTESGLTRPSQSAVKVITKTTEGGQS
jgi:predicted CopG family antitoxin